MLADDELGVACLEGGGTDALVFGAVLGDVGVTEDVPQMADSLLIHSSPYISRVQKCGWQGAGRVLRWSALKCVSERVARPERCHGALVDPSFGENDNPQAALDQNTQVVHPYRIRTFRQSGEMFGLAEQILRIELMQVLREEESVFANDFAVEEDLATAVFGALDLDHVPVNL